MPDIRPQQIFNWRVDLEDVHFDLREELSQAVHEQIMRQIDADIIRQITSSDWNSQHISWPSWDISKRRKIRTGPGIDKNGIPVDYLEEEVSEDSFVFQFNNVTS